MQSGVEDHRPLRIAGFSAVVAVVVPAGEDLGQAADGVLGVGIGADAAFGRAVLGEFDQTDGEQLQHFTRVVLIGHAAGGQVFLLVAAHVEIAAHAGRQRHGFEQSAVGAEGVGFEHIDISRGDESAPGDGQAGHRDDEDLAQSQRHALAQRVGCADQLAPQGVVGAREAVDIGHRGVAASDHPVVVALRARLRKLGVKPGAVALALDAGHGRVAGAETGLAEEAGGFTVAGGDDRGWGDGGIAATAAATAGREQRRGAECRPCAEFVGDAVSDAFSVGHRNRFSHTSPRFGVCALEQRDGVCDGWRRLGKPAQSDVRNVYRHVSRVGTPQR